MTQITPSQPRYGNELDALLHAALSDLLSIAADPAQTRAVVQRLKHDGPVATVSPAVRDDQLQRRRWRPRPVSTIALSATLCALWFGAQTPLWARVYAGYGLESGPTALAAAIPYHEPGLRFLLLLHVSGLTVGLLGMFVVWAQMMVRWSWSVSKGQTLSLAVTPRLSRVHRIMLTCCGAGLVLGCLWSLLERGLAWSWAPPEVAALFSVGIGTLWYLANRSQMAVQSLQSATLQVVTASLAFWLIAVLNAVASSYAAQGHTYGFPSKIPTLLVSLMIGNLAWLAGAYWWRSRKRE